MNERDDSNGAGGDSPSSVANDVKTTTSKVLDFLANANNETLSACFLGLGLTTYLVFGRLGLLLIGVVIGVVLHAHYASGRWDGIVRDESATSLIVVNRLLSLRSDAKVEDESAALGKEASNASRHLGYSQFRPQISAALTELSDAVIRDYVKWWYSPILPDETSFPDSCRATLDTFLTNLGIHQAKKRPSDTFLDFLTNAASIVIVLLNEAGKIVQDQVRQGRIEATHVHAYVKSHQDSPLAEILDVNMQRRKLTAASNEMLIAFLDKETYDCPPVRSFLLQVLAFMIFDPTLERCANKDWINEWIVYLLEEGEPEILNVIDAGVGAATSGDTQVANRGKSEPVAKEKEVPVSVPVVDARPELKTRRDSDVAAEEAKALTAILLREQELPPPLPVRPEGTGFPTSSKPLPDPRTSAEPNQSRTTSLAGAVDSVKIEDSTANVMKPLPKVGQLSHDSHSIDGQTSLNNTSQPVAEASLFNATISIFDDSRLSDTALIKSRPNIDYILQVELHLSSSSGWMITRNLADIERLHEVMKRIAAVSGIRDFAQNYADLPGWKGKTKERYRQDLEDYLREALSKQGLAESGAMKKFFEKERSLPNRPTSKSVLGFNAPDAFQNVGKGVMGVLTNAPKGAAESGKALFGGVTNVFSMPKKDTSTVLPSSPGAESLKSTKHSNEYFQDTSSNRNSIEDTPAPRKSMETSGQISQANNSPERSDIGYQGITDADSQADTQEEVHDTKVSVDVFPENGDEPGRSLPVQEEEMHLPPPPDSISDDYGGPAKASALLAARRQLADDAESGAALQIPPPESGLKTELSDPGKTAISWAPLTESETMMAIELIFALINELYNMSSVWNIRKTMLNAAKGVLLRPGSQTLQSTKVLLQETVIDANTSETGIATQLRKLRENSLPTPEELAKWPAPRTEEESDKLQQKARSLLIERGLPQALMSVMGAAGSREALGHVFDLLQIHSVARGLLFAILLQAVRAINH